MATNAIQQVVEAPRPKPAAIFPSASVFSKLSGADRERLRTILNEPIEYLDHESFARVSTAKQLFGAYFAHPKSVQPWCNSAEAVVEERVLKVTTLSGEQEQRLFLRMNYARYRIARILSEFARKRLTAKAVHELLWWHEQMTTARVQIVQANLPLVLAMAKRTKLGNIDYAELISEGNMALLRSVDKFDTARGFKFSTYACRAILKSFSRVAMRTSRYRGRFPTEFDPSLEKSDYQETVREEIEIECVDELRTILAQNAADLNDVEVKVIQARFALGQVSEAEGEGPKTLEQVGMMIGVTKERVRQIQNRALSKLREQLQKDFLAA